MYLLGIFSINEKHLSRFFHSSLRSIFCRFKFNEELGFITVQNNTFVSMGYWYNVVDKFNGDYISRKLCYY